MHDCIPAVVVRIIDNGEGTDESRHGQARGRSDESEIPGFGVDPIIPNTAFDFNWIAYRIGLLRNDWIILQPVQRSHLKGGSGDPAT